MFYDFSSFIVNPVEVFSDTDSDGAPTKVIGSLDFISKL